MQKRSMFTTKQITLVAVLIAMAIVLKSFMSIETTNFRITFFDIPLLISGIIFGPVIGGIAGFIVDFVHILFSPFAFSFNIFTLGTMVWGIIPGLLLFNRKMTKTKLIIAIVVASFLSFGLNSVGIVQFYGMGSFLASLYTRIAVLFIKLPIQIIVIETLYNRVVLTQLDFVKSR